MHSVQEFHLLTDYSFYVLCCSLTVAYYRHICPSALSVKNYTEYGTFCQLTIWTILFLCYPFSDNVHFHTYDLCYFFYLLLSFTTFSIFYCFLLLFLSFAIFAIFLSSSISQPSQPLLPLASAVFPVFLREFHPAAVRLLLFSRDIPDPF